jgi:Flp pilus assembly protein TadG
MKAKQLALRSRRSRKGTATVDFALTFPLVLGIFMAMIFFVQVFLYKNTASNAAYEAARKGIVLGATDAEIESAAENVMSTLAINQKEIRIDKTTETITVTISIPMQGNSWATGTLFPTDVSVGASCTLRYQMD